MIQYIADLKNQCLLNSTVNSRAPSPVHSLFPSCQGSIYNLAKSPRGSVYGLSGMMVSRKQSVESKCSLDTSRRDSINGIPNRRDSIGAMPNPALNYERFISAKRRCSYVSQRKRWWTTRRPFFRFGHGFFGCKNVRKKNELHWKYAGKGSRI